jgi:hypothetical protein
MLLNGDSERLHEECRGSGQARTDRRFIESEIRLLERRGRRNPADASLTGHVQTLAGRRHPCFKTPPLPLNAGSLVSRHLPSGASAGCAVTRGSLPG